MMEKDMNDEKLPVVDGLYAGVHRDEDGQPAFCVKVAGAIFNVGPISAVEDFLKSYRQSEANA